MTLVPVLNKARVPIIDTAACMELPACDCCVGFEDIRHEQQECCNKMEHLSLHMLYVRRSEAGGGN
jgi:hypothetical protein